VLAMLLIVILVRVANRPTLEEKFAGLRGIERQGRKLVTVRIAASTKRCSRLHRGILERLTRNQTGKAQKTVFSQI